MNLDELLKVIDTCPEWTCHMGQWRQHEETACRASLMFCSVTPSHIRTMSLQGKWQWSHGLQTVALFCFYDKRKTPPRQLGPVSIMAACPHMWACQAAESEGLLSAAVLMAASSGSLKTSGLSAAGACVGIFCAVFCSACWVKWNKSTAVS